MVNERVSLGRLAVMASALAALVTDVLLQQRGWPGLSMLIVLYAAAGAGLAAWRPRFAVGTLMFLACLVPTITDLAANYRVPGTNLFWLAGVAGTIAVRAGRAWAFPLAWRGPLVYWALAIAISWPIVAGREIAFDLSRLSDYRLITTSVGIPPAVHVAWIANIASTTLLSLLWVDLLFDLVEQHGGRALERFAAVPFAAGASLAAAVGVYQMSVDIEFLNHTFFGALGRPTGTMIDGNAFGAASALGAAVWLTMAVASPSRSRAVAYCGATLLCWAGAWASASRTAFLIVAVTGAGASMAVLHRASSKRRTAILNLTVPLIVLAIGAMVFLPGIRPGGPFARAFESVSTQAWNRNARTIAADLVARDGYGTTAHGMIREFPLAGVGIGTFQALSVDYSRRYGVDEVRPDNAQNWFRHQLAEIGILGSLGWMAWLAAFLATARRALRGPAGTPAWIVMSALVGFGLASMLGVPSMNATVLWAFLTLVVWLAAMSPEEPKGAAGHARDRPRTRQGRLLVLGAVTALVVFTGVTAWSAITSLRIPARAASTGWPYMEGFSRLDGSASPPSRWIGREAVAVLQPDERFLRLRFRADHPDIAAQPVDVRVKLNDRTVIRERLRSHATIERYVELPADRPFVRLAFFVSRTFVPGGEDTRELGLAIDRWEFLDAPPSDAWVVK